MTTPRQDLFAANARHPFRERLHCAFLDANHLIGQASLVHTEHGSPVFTMQDLAEVCLGWTNGDRDDLHALCHALAERFEL